LFPAPASTGLRARRADSFTIASPGTSPPGDQAVRQNTRHYLRPCQMLQIKNLNQFYGGGHILRDLSFDIPMG